MAKPKINLSTNAEPTAAELADLTPNATAPAKPSTRQRGRPRKNLTTTPAPITEPEITVADSAVTIEMSIPAGVPVGGEILPAPTPEPPMSEEERELRKILAEMAAKRAERLTKPDPEPEPEPIPAVLEETGPEPLVQVDLNVKINLPAQITAEQGDLYRAAQNALAAMEKFMALAAQLETLALRQESPDEAVDA